MKNTKTKEDKKNVKEMKSKRTRIRENRQEYEMHLSIVNEPKNAC